MMRATAVAFFSIMLFGCGASQVDQEKVLLETTSIEEENEAQKKLDELVKKDSKRALKILQGAMRGRNLAAAWAAVYVKRLGVNCDNKAAKEALILGTQSDDPLLLALSWLWLAVEKQGDLPKWRDSWPDPVVGIIAAIAYAGRGEIPKELLKELCIPGEAASKQQSKPENREVKLIALTLPFDSGAIAKAIAFCEARYYRWTEKDSKNELAWVADRLREELVKDTLGRRLETNEVKAFCADPDLSRLKDRLALPILEQPVSMLRKVALNGRGSLRIDALRALAIASKNPKAGDLAACSAAMRSDDPITKIEAARTYLLLAARAVE
jgi:hypothetical protein